MQAASDVYSPVSGEVVEINESLSDDPSKVRMYVLFDLVIKGCIYSICCSSWCLRFMFCIYHFQSILLSMCTNLDACEQSDRKYTSQVNSEPFEGGWMMKIKVSNAGDVDELLDAGAYEAHCEAGGH